MLKNLYIIPILFSAFNLFSQNEIILSDGFVGFDYEIVNDTVVVDFIKKNSPAQQAGIKKGDKILQVDSVPVSGNGNSIFAYNVFWGKINTKLKILYLNAETAKVDSTYLKREEDLSFEHTLFNEIQLFADTAGLYSIQDVSANRFFKNSLVVGNRELIIDSVLNGGLAEKYNLKKQDEVCEINGKKVRYGIDVTRIINGYTGDSVVLALKRDGAYVFYTLPYAGEENLSEWLGIMNLYETMPHSQSTWIKCTLKSNTSVDRDYLLSVWGDTVELYIQHNDGTFIKKTTGNALTLSERDVQYGFTSGFKMELRKGEIKNLYIKVILESDETFEAPMLVSFDHFLAKDKQDRFVVGLFLGIALIIAIYNLILFFFVRELRHLYYVLYILFFGLLFFAGNGYGFELLWPNQLEFEDWIGFISFGTMIMFFALFGKSYLNIKQHLPLWNKAINMQLFVIVLSLLFITITQSFDYKYNETIDFVLLAIFLSVFFLITTPAIILQKRKHRPALYFLSANAIIVLGLILGVLLMFVFHSYIIFDRFIQASVIVQIIIFSVGLGEKIRQANKENEQAQLKIIQQLQENKALQAKVNRELEQKVLERTAVIEQAKEEITAQRDEIEAQRDSLSEQKDYLQKVNDEVEASISYAERIQSSMLPSEKVLEENLVDFFLLFKPRDIVSGDFYWFKKVKNFLIVTAADCTGHGVPGAFMSMLGVSFLNEIVSKSRFDSSDEILNRLREKVKKALKQKGEIGENKDGMDMALCVIDLETNELQFSGAYNPLYIIRNNELIEIKADRQPIAVYIKEQPFSMNTMQLKKNDCLYMFSDGYVDQFGGSDGKKFMSKRFKNYLLKNANKPMKDQKHLLNTTFDSWKKNNDQMDDVIVIGLRI